MNPGQLNLLNESVMVQKLQTINFPLVIPDGYYGTNQARIELQAWQFRCAQSETQPEAQRGVSASKAGRGRWA